MRKKCCFVFFDNEEWGLLGSGGFANHCKKNGIDLSGTKVINFDCVGNGDVLTFASTQKTAIIDAIAKAFEENGQKPVKKRSAMIFLSDHANFKNSGNYSVLLRNPQFLHKVEKWEGSEKNQRNVNIQEEKKVVC